MSGLLYHLSPSDPSTMAGATALLVGAAILATLVPARRALRLDPIRALRSE
jgi:ABC-type antimicrobial peptide transport system permease subunit